MTGTPFLGLAAIVVTLAVPVCLTLVSIRLLMTNTYLSIEFHKPDFPPDDYGFTLDDRLHYGVYAVDYLTNSADISYLGNLTFPNGQSFFNSRELQHMADVKRVTQTALTAGWAVVAVLALLSLLMGRSAAGRAALRSGLFRGAALTLGLLVALAAGVLLAWDTFFTRFHELFFANGTWQFEYSDSLIRLYPERFWQDAALTIGGLSAIGALAILIGCTLWARRAAKTTHANPLVQTTQVKGISP
ncbi:MAG: TIGR01906 family membrane protein [Aggregatilineales bacterium]